LLQSYCPYDIYRQRTVDPSRQITVVIDTKVVTTRQDRDTGARGACALEDDITEMPARVGGDDDVGVDEGDVLHARWHERYPAGQSWPCGDQRLMQSSARWRKCRIHDERLARGVVEQEHRVREEAMTAAKIDNTAAAKETPDAARGFPRLE
jgi:hypothetical protein